MLRKRIATDAGIGHGLQGRLKCAPAVNVGIRGDITIIADVHITARGWVSKLIS